MDILKTVPISNTNIKIGKEFNRTALEGLLNFLEALYEDLLHDIENGLQPVDAIKGELQEIKRLKSVWLK